MAGRVLRIDRAVRYPWGGFIMGRESSRFAAAASDFPAQLILRIECPDGEIWLINPFNGESVNERLCWMWLGNIWPVSRTVFV